MQTTLQNLQNSFSQEIEQAATVADIEAIKIRYLGKKGSLQELMKNLREVPVDERPAVGKSINDLKEEITQKIEAKSNLLNSSEQEQRLANETIDVTLPGRKRFQGRKHPVTQILDEMLGILSHMGFSVQLGPEVDTEFYNFEALNISEGHPARDMQDTFYITSNVLLRTHTSNVQMRVMENQTPPIRVVSPGKSFRNEDISARSHVFFHQIEAFYIDKGVSFADLLGTMEAFLKQLFGTDIEMRVRPSYFPFVEPGMEVDIRCLACKGNGCSLCKQSGWLEIAGAGMVHPEVLKCGGIDPEEYSGFAWGMGVERTLMLKTGIQDIRLLTENDLRFLSQFP